MLFNLQKQLARMEGKSVAGYTEKIVLRILQKRGIFGAFPGQLYHDETGADTQTGLYTSYITLSIQNIQEK